MDKIKVGYLGKRNLESDKICPVLFAHREGENRMF